jgi:hypothetical protein
VFPIVNVLLPNLQGAVFSVRHTHAPLSQLIVLVFSAVLFDQGVAASLKLLTDRDLLPEALPGGLILLEDVAVPDGVPALFEGPFHSDSLESLHHQLLVNVILAGACSQTTLFPLMKFVRNPLSSLRLASMSQSQEDTLLEGHGGH